MEMRGITAKILGAVFGPESISNKVYAGIGLHLLDNGMNFEELMQLAIETALGADATNHAMVVNLLYENVVGFAPSAEEAAYYVGLLDHSIYTTASIGVMAARHTAQPSEYRPGRLDSNRPGILAGHCSPTLIHRKRSMNGAPLSVPDTFRQMHDQSMHSVNFTGQSYSQK